MSIQKQVFLNLKTKLQELPWANLVEFENIRLLASEFNAHEFPAIQIYDNGETATQLKGRTSNILSISIELVLMRSAVTGLVDQGQLFDKKLEIKQKIGEDPRLGINGGVDGTIMHIQYVAGATDLHSLAPHYLARLDFEVLFHEPFSC
jgi:hypothetical protein